MMPEAFLRRLPVAFRKRWGLDKNELAFIDAVGSSKCTNNEGSGPRVLLQMPSDYYILSLFCVACVHLRPSETGGLWHQSIMSAPRGETWPKTRRLLRQLFNRLDRVKWGRLYSSIGVRHVHTLNPGLLTAIKLNSQAKTIWRGLKNKSDLLSLELNGTHCGDLIYDTYLRYRVQPTVDLKDIFLRELITHALCAQAAVRQLLQQGRYEVFLTSYTSYIQHGIPAREALRMGLNVYSAGNLSQYFKRLSKEDSLHTAAHWRYRDNFQRLDDADRARKKAREMLEKRFAGGVDVATLYMKESAYALTDEVMPDGVEGVVFLHDFFDSPHCHRNMLFSDFLEWTHHTLSLIDEHKLPFAVKPHPNQLPESKEVVSLLRRQYPNIRWLPSGLSNKTIFSSGIRCGVSIYGTILHELAYHGIAALAAGDHPHTEFRVAITPNSIEEYSSYLLNYRELSVASDVKEEVLAFCYMHNMQSDEGLALQLEGKGFREIGPNDTAALSCFLEKNTTFPLFNN